VGLTGLDRVFHGGTVAGGRRRSQVLTLPAREEKSLSDSESEVSQILKTKHVFVLKQELGTIPRFFYYFDQEYPRTAGCLPKEGYGDAFPESAGSGDQGRSGSGLQGAPA
jgi:hypothetical protein